MADAGPFGPASVLVFGLGAAVAWGMADFGGGLASRRSTVYGVVLGMLAVGLVAALVLAIVRREAIPSTADVAWAALGGLAAGLGILSLYAGLAVGRMGIVAPVTGVLAATVPVVAGIVLEGLPPPLVLLGIALAVVAVVLVSRVADASSGRSGIELAILAGVGLGTFSIVISRVDERLVFGPLVVVRLVELALVAAVVAVLRGSVRVPRSMLPAVALIGVLDMAGIAGFMLAEASGALAVAAVLTSMYPVTTVVLAAVLLHEPVTRHHAVGIAAAAAAIVLIGAGQAP
jgi:drug/metabolite transporter (DMT)-like permease